MKQLFYLLLLAISFSSTAQDVKMLRLDTDVAMVLYYKGYENGDTVKLTRNTKTQFGFFPAGKVKVTAKIVNDKISKNATQYKITTHEGNKEVILLKGPLSDFDKKNVSFELKKEGLLSIHLE